VDVLEVDGDDDLLLLLLLLLVVSVRYRALL